MKFWILATLVFCGTAHAHPMLGGNSGGGGMLTPPDPMDRAELEFFIKEKVPKLARMHFNYVFQPFVSKDQTGPRWVQVDRIEGEESEEVNRSIYTKLFQQSPTLLERMSATRIQLQDTPCFDPATGDQKDASANAEKNELCFNVKALLVNTPARVLRSHVLALAVHEYAHLSGATESEAEFIEKWAKLTMTVDGAILSRVEGQWEGIELEKELTVTVHTLIDEVMTLNPVALAFRVDWLAAQIESRITRVYELIGNSGLSGWSPDQRVRSFLAAIKASQLSMFKCSLPEIKSSPERQGCQRMQGMPEDGSGADFDVLAKANDVHFLLPISGFVRDTTNGDRVALKAELQEMEVLLKGLFAPLDTAQ